MKTDYKQMEKVHLKDLKDKESKVFFRYFPNNISKEIHKEVVNSLNLFRRYIFVVKQGKRRIGFCTHCNKEFSMNPVNQNNKYKCPKCGSECMIKHQNYSRKYMQDHIYFIYYEKSKKDPNIVIARGIHGFRDYSEENFKDVPTQYTVYAMYLFEKNKSTMYRRSYWDKRFIKKKSVYSLTNTEFFTRINQSCFNIKEAIRGTFLERSNYKFSIYPNTSSECYEDYVKHFSAFVKYPAIEYLNMNGFRQLVEDRVYGYRNYRAMNWKAKTINDLLNLDKKTYKRIRGKDIDSEELAMLQIVTKYGFLDVDDFIKLFNIGYLNMQILKKYEFIFEYATPIKTFNYISKQFEIRKSVNTNYCTATKRSYRASILSDWVDYLKQALDLGMDIKASIILFPKDLDKAHQETIKKLKYKENMELNNTIYRRGELLNKKYSMEFEGIIVKAAMSSKELIDEGNALKHCVGGYVDRYARGYTNILFIRKVDNPDTPFFTIEVSRDGVLVQCRGYKNIDYTEILDVNRFVEKFKSEKLNTLKRQRIA